LSTCMACVALAYLYLHCMQDAIPDFRWDLHAVCDHHRKGAFHGSLSQYR
jgi:hypothetical protein